MGRARKTRIRRFFNRTIFMTFGADGNRPNHAHREEVVRRDGYAKALFGYSLHTTHMLYRRGALTEPDACKLFTDINENMIRIAYR